MTKAAKSTGTATASATVSKKLLGKVLSSAKTAKVKRSQLQFAVYNPRSMTAAAFRKLCASVKRFGLVEPPVVNVRTGYRVVGGHQRIRATDKLLQYNPKTLKNDYLLDIRLIDVDEPTEKALNVALNNPEMQAEFDLDLLQDLIGDMFTSGQPIEDTGFSERDLAVLFDDDFLVTVMGAQSEQGEQVHAEQNIVKTLDDMYESRARQSGKEKSGVESGELDSQNEPAPSEDDATLNQTLKDRRRTYIAGRRQNQDDPDTMLTLVFDNRQQLGEFLRAFRLPPDDRYVDGVAFLELVGDPGESGEPGE